jgi:hypothetical protein
MIVRNELERRLPVPRLAEVDVPEVVVTFGRIARSSSQNGVVGLLAAALYDPVFTEGIISPMAMAIAAAAFVSLLLWKTPPWLVVVVAGVAGQFLL